MTEHGQTLVNVGEPTEAVREGVFLVIGLAGASGSGKTFSAMRLAQGLVGHNRKFAVVDTEMRRARHYAPASGEKANFTTTFYFDHLELSAPFRPDAYLAAIRKCTAYPVVVVDSFSHEHEGQGGVLDWAEEILKERVARALQKPDNRKQEWELRNAYLRMSWIEPKMSHKRMVQQLLQMRTHLILCLRAEDKIDMVQGADGKLKIVPMETLAGFKGWIPICDKRLPFELTASFVLTPDKPGVPKPIKLQEQHKPFFPLDQPITEKSGEMLAAWARGGSPPAPVMAQSEPVNGHAPGAPDAPVSARDALLAGIAEKQEALGLGPKVKGAQWQTHVGSADAASAPIDKLQALDDALTARCKAERR